MSESNLKMAGVALVGMLLAFSADAVTLIKADEAKLPAGAGVLATRGITRGPAIKILTPDLTNLTSPFDLKVAFEARGGAKIDAAATKVIYLKAKPVDLLARVKPGLSEAGLDLPGAETPPGEHQIQIIVQDSEGRSSQVVMTLNVVK
ncbi:hypothetical protein KI614_14275 [Dechloromonas denitrificans]|jgi:hypothetical protein|uniref:hypothetical protein n=1 Tax=Dechloromonas denitrificans TaxID=281362 RepID=UPI001CF88416|nr:hypothetical protein [Dechloromonas denitrificans]UCV11296.1 hypothetical protein KI614_14275 [Dechloromonas denitrificans]